MEGVAVILDEAQRVVDLSLIAGRRGYRLGFLAALEVMDSALGRGDIEPKHVWQTLQDLQDWATGGALQTWASGEGDVQPPVSPQAIFCWPPDDASDGPLF